MTSLSLIRSGLRRTFALGILVIGLSAGFAPAAFATKIERVTSPSGIEAWLVQEHALPMIAMEFAFVGGSSQDPAERPGLSYLLSTMLDEGAGDLKSEAYGERLEAKAIELRFSTNRDYFTGSLRTLTENRDEAIELLRLALTAPRFDQDAIIRMQTQIVAGLQQEDMSPNDLAGRHWWEKAFAGHPYGHPVHGTIEGIKASGAADLRSYVGRVFARDTLKIAIVGDIDAAAAGKIIDTLFATLPAKADLLPVPETKPQALGGRMPVELNVAQSSVILGGPGIKRRDPDYVAAYLVNHILGGGSFTSRLYKDIRESRGLAYSVYSMVLPMQKSSVFFVATGTRSDRVQDTIGVIEDDVRRMAKDGPTAEELEQAKTFVKGSYGLAFDSSLKIANQLLLIQLEELGIDYVDKRNALIDAVTIADAKRVAQRLLDNGLFVTIAGRMQSDASPAPAAVRAQ